MSPNRKIHRSSPSSSNPILILSVFISLLVHQKCSTEAFLSHKINHQRQTQRQGQQHPRWILQKSKDPPLPKRSHKFPTTSLRLSETTPTPSTPTAPAAPSSLWEEVHGNYILRPPSPSTPPRALIHFLGGALVGAAPNQAYRYLLERLASKGYLIVATPFDLSFDYLTICDSILEKFEKIAPSLARQYGPVPVIGVGHSLGAVLQLLITSLFPDTPRAGNALLSYNNKGVEEAIPAFEQIFAPLFVQLAEKNEQSKFSSNDGLGMGFRVARCAVNGEIPGDELIQEVNSFLTAGMLKDTPLGDNFTVPEMLRDGWKGLVAPSLALAAPVLPLLNQTLDVLEQIPSLVDEVAEGAKDFIPPPASIQRAARRAYRARRTLLIQYSRDVIDESPKVEKLLLEAEAVMRVKRPMVTMDIKRVVLGKEDTSEEKGDVLAGLTSGHAAPLLAPPLDLVKRAEDILGESVSRERLGYEIVDSTVDELVKWMEEGAGKR